MKENAMTYGIHSEVSFKMVIAFKVYFISHRFKSY